MVYFPVFFYAKQCIHNSITGFSFSMNYLTLLFFFLNIIIITLLSILKKKLNNYVDFLISINKLYLE